MRCKLICLVLVGVGLWGGCQKAAIAPPPDTDVLIRWHFVGADHLAHDTNAARWVALGGLPASQQLLDQTLRKLAGVPYQLFQHRVAAGTNTYAPFIQTLLDSLARAESCAELRCATNQTPEFALAVRLNPVAAGVWSTNLSAILSAWTGVQPNPIPIPAGAGWELRKHHAPNLFQFIHAGAWVVLGCGQDKLPLQAEWLRRIAAQGRPLDATNEFWLDVSVDWPRLEPQLSLPLPFHLPQTHLTLTGSSQSIRTRIDLLCSRLLPQAFEPWRIPTNTIHEPLDSFTACRGIAPWLNRFIQNQRLHLESTPDQLYLWAIDEIPFQTFLAFPSQNPTNDFERLAPDLLARFNTRLLQQDLGAISSSTNSSRLAWQGLPFVVPFVEPVSEPAGRFLLAGLFPNTPKVSPPPPELLQQLGSRTNLVYYDWELTRRRVNQCRSIVQLVQIVANQPLIGTTATSMRWLDAISPDLGNTVTEITVAGPRQMTLIRKSPVGLTAMELVLLANWLESPWFPLGDYHLPARTNATASLPAATSSDAQARP